MARLVQVDLQALFRFTRKKKTPRRSAQLSPVLLATVVLIALSGCAASKVSSGHGSSQPSTEPSYASEPFTHEQQLVEQGARLVVSDGCSVCHLANMRQGIGPSFGSFAGHYVTLANGRRALINERFLRGALLHPDRNPISGYSASPMIAAVKRVHLSSEPKQIAALVAFIEQIGSEPEPGAASP
jgi:hypothetical protein